MSGQFDDNEFFIFDDIDETDNREIFSSSRGKRTSRDGVSRGRHSAENDTSYPRKAARSSGYTPKRSTSVQRNRNAGAESSHSGRQRQSYVSARRRRKKTPALKIVVLILLILLVIPVVISLGSFSLKISSLEQVHAMVSAVSSDSVTVSWDQVDKANGYHVYMRAEGDAGFTKEGTVSGADALSYTIDELQQAGTYSFYVTAYNLFAESDGYTALENIRTLPASPAVTDVSVDEHGVIHVEWSANDKADGYYVYFKRSDEEYSDKNRAVISDGATHTADIGVTEADTDYNVKVLAYLDGDTSLVSGAAEEKTVSVQAIAFDPDVETTANFIDNTIDPERPMIALTFDDGPCGLPSSERILDTFERYGGRATFFMIGNNAAKYPENVRRKAELGMELGNHTWDHTKYGENIGTDDIYQCNEAVYEITGQHTTAFRSPGGVTTESIKRECAAEGMSLYYWTIDTEDWRTRNADEIYHAVMDHVKDGDIVLMHEIYEATADAVERMVPQLQSMGYQLVTCHDLIKAKTGADPEPGTQYFSAYGIF